jgi:hypothetical protein
MALLVRILLLMALVSQKPTLNPWRPPASADLTRPLSTINTASPCGDHVYLLISDALKLQDTLLS